MRLAAPVRRSFKSVKSPHALSGRRSAQRRINAAVKPVMEGMEGRLLFAVWDGSAGDFNWNTADNWDSGNVPDVAGETAVFAGAIEGTINLATSVAPSSVSVTAGNYTFSGPGGIGGAATLTKSGAGTLTLSGVNAYTGGTTINAGTLKYDLTGRTGSSQNLRTNTVAANGTLELYNTNTAVDNGTGLLQGTTTFLGSGTINKTGAGYVGFWNNSGAQTSIKNFTGQINVVAGTLASNGSDWNTSAGQMDLDVASGAAFDIRTGAIVINELTGSGTIGSSFNVGVGLTVGANGGTATFSGVIRNGNAGTWTGVQPNTGVPSLTKSGAGTQTLTGTNTYTGTTTISGGTLQIGNGGTTGTLGTGAVTDNASLHFNRSNTVTVGNAIGGTGTVTHAGSGTTTFTGTKNYTGVTTINAGTLELLNTTTYTAATTVSSGATLQVSNTANMGMNAPITLNNGSTLTHNGLTSGNCFWTNSQAVTVAAGANVTLNEASVTNTTGVNKGTFLDGGLKGGGSGAVVTINATNAGNHYSLRNNNTNCAGTIIVNGIASATTNAGSGLAISSSITGLQNADLTVIGTLELGNTGLGWANGFTSPFTNTIGALNGSGIVVENGNSGAGNLITLIVGKTNNNGNFAGGIVTAPGGGRIALTKIGNGTQTLSGANTCNGTTTISAGTLQVGNGGTAGSLGSGTVTNNAALVFDRSDTITVANAVSGTGTLTQNGAGTLILTGTNTYGGTTAVNNGTLLVNGTHTTGSGAYSVASGATLGGTGNLGSHVVNVASFGNLAPGASVGILSTGNLSLASDSNYLVEMNGGADQTNVTGTVSLGGSNLVLTSTRTNGNGVALTIIKNDGSDAVTGTFTGLGEGAAVTANGVNYFITYIYNADTNTLGTGNDVALIDNTPPTAGPDSYTLNEDTPLNVVAPGVLVNDTDPQTPHQTLTVSKVNGSSANVGMPVATAKGTVTIQSNGSLVYTPDANEFGSDSITVYTATDGIEESSPATITFNISEVNDATAASDDNLSSIAEDSGVRTISFASLVGNDSKGAANESGQSLTIISVGNAVGGSVSISGTDVLFTPATDFNGPASFDYTVQDNGTTNDNADPLTDIGSVSFTITEVNDAPVASDDSATIAEDSGANAINVLANDNGGPANENQALTVTAVTQGSNGSVTTNGTTTTYTPSANFFGSDSYTYTIADSDGATTTATVNVTVTSVNDAPVANDDSDSVNEDGSVTTNVLANDNGGPANEDQTLTVTAVTQGANGTVTTNGTTTTYTPAANFFGTDSYTYTIADSDGATSTATVSITVDSVNDAPTANNDSANTAQGTAVTVNVVGNDNGGPANENQSLTVTAVTNGAHGTVEINGAGTVTYTPSSVLFNGTDSFTYTVIDSDGAASTATVSVTVSPVGAGTIVTLPDTALGGTALLITGTSLDDVIVVEPGATSGTIKVTFNGFASTHAKPTGRIIVTGEAGHDNIQIAGAITNSVWLYGDAGNDRLNAGNVASRGNMLIGGDGNDDLLGGNGRDVMIGGKGADKIVANGNDDILVAAYTLKDGRASANHEVFWSGALTEWAGGNDFADRVRNLRYGMGGAPNLVAQVKDDSCADTVSLDVDSLNGASGDDWFIYDATGADKDKVSGQVEASCAVE